MSAAAVLRCSRSRNDHTLKEKHTRRAQCSRTALALANESASHDAAADAAADDAVASLEANRAVFVDRGGSLTRGRFVSSGEQLGFHPDQ